MEESESIDDLVGAIEPPGVVDSMSFDERVDEFFRLLGEGVKVRAAAALVAVHFTTLYRKKRADPEFAKRWKDAEHVSVPQLAAEAERRAMRGSDKLLMFLLTNYAPERFKKASSLEITNPDGSLAGSDTERAAKLQAILATARARKAAMAIEDLL